jgi:predicted dehydrogenase
MSHGVTRRGFLKSAGLAGGLIVLTGTFKTNAYAANAKLNVAFVGVGGQAHAGYGMASGQNVVAMCDADSGRWGDLAKDHPEAKTYTDWRKIYDNHKDINLVHIATPDHTHFPAAYSALIRGYACYCEKPLTHSIWEARMLGDLTKKMKVPTQMGNMGHANDSIRRIVEWVRAGTIGDVKEVHTWTNRPVWPQGKLGPFKSATPPANLNWDAWLGVAPKKDYFVNNDGKSPVHPFAWRGWFDYGCGAVGDMGCHTWDCVWWSMDPKAPLSAEPVKIVDIGTDTFPKQMIAKWEFGPSADGKRPAFTAFWYEGGLKPAAPEELGGGKGLGGSGSLFIGTKGKLLTEGDYSEGPRLLPASRMADFKANEMSKITQIPRSPGHREELMKAIRGEEAWDFPKSNFTYGGPLVEAMNLANVAVRLGKKVTWDPVALKCPGTPEADPLIKRPYRKEFWEVPSDATISTPTGTKA